VRSLISVGVCVLVVTAVSACGGGRSNQPSSRAIRGSHFVFRAPFAWHVKRSGNQVGAAPKPIAPELVSVTLFPLLRAYRPALFKAVSRELDSDAKQLASRLAGSVESSATVVVAGIRSRQYVLGYKTGGQDLHQRITFVLRGKTEFQLLCRWAGREPDACGQLTTSFTPTP
jgi:hypothetical protein